MPKFSQSSAAQVDTSLPSNPIVTATDLCTHGNVIEMYDKRVAKTEFGEAVFVDFNYSDDPYDENGFKAAYTTVFTVNSPAFKQLQAVELNLHDPLECKVVSAGRSFKLADADAPTSAPISRQDAPTAKPAQGVSRPGVNAGSRTPAPTSAAATRPSPSTRPQPRQRPVTLSDEDVDELPF